MKKYVIIESRFNETDETTSNKKIAFFNTWEEADAEVKKLQKKREKENKICSLRCSYYIHEDDGRKYFYYAKSVIDGTEKEVGRKFTTEGEALYEGQKALLDDPDFPPECKTIFWNEDGEKVFDYDNHHFVVISQNLE